MNYAVHLSSNPSMYALVKHQLIYVVLAISKWVSRSKNSKYHLWESWYAHAYICSSS